MSNPLFCRAFSKLVVSVLFAALLFSPLFAEAKGNPKYAAIVMDADTGMILHQSNANKALHPASLTKVMTLLLLFDALEGGEVNLKDRIRISKYAASMQPSKLGLAPGSSIKVQDAIKALVTKSANDVAVAVGEHLGGSQKGFAAKMNRKAIEIGMTRTTFKNASGLHDPQQLTTARDMARMAQYVINNYPDYYKNFSLASFTYNGHTYRSHNRLMSTYKGMDGMKTGYIAPSGFNLIASAVRNNRRIIGVVFGGRTSKTRNAHMEMLLDNGFAKMKDIRVASAKVPVPVRKPQVIQALAALDSSVRSSAQIASITPEQAGYDELIGQGDFDPALSKRFEAGLMAIAAYRGEKFEPPKAKVMNVAYAPVPASTKIKAPISDKDSVAPWSVQIGAFTSRVATDEAIQKALGVLPKPYNQAQPLIAPLKTSQGWLFRARITGYTRAEALAACNYIDECLPVAPAN